MSLPFSPGFLISPREENVKARAEFTHHQDKAYGSDGRQRVLQTAAVLFKSAGLRGTSVSMIARAAGIPEGAVYAHFETKEGLFREIVRINMDTRLGLLEARTVSAICESEAAAVECIAEATVKVCTSDAGNSILTSWALLEDHEYAANLYRDEIGSVEFLWNRALEERFGDTPARRILSIHLVPHAVNASLAYGYWLASLRHDEFGAAAIAQGFVAGIGQTAAVLLSRGGRCDPSLLDGGKPHFNLRNDE
jgi:AcrR family transcriptional regulator